jgi:hypothetical protein
MYFIHKILTNILCFVGRASRYMWVMKSTWCTVYLQFIRSRYLYTFQASSSSLGPVSIIASVCTAALGVLCNPKYSIQPRFSSPVPRIKRQRSLTEAVLMSFGSTSRFPKTLKRWQANASQWQTMCCNVSGLLVAHHQEVTMYICNIWYVLYVVVDCQLVWLGSNHSNHASWQLNEMYNTYQLSHIYMVISWWWATSKPVTCRGIVTE